MIELKDVVKSFGEKKVLKGISTIFDAGKINLVIGSSGSGKSVLMRSMVGLMNIDSGSIAYNNRVLDYNDYMATKEIRRDIGMLFQGSALFNSSSVQDNIDFPLKMFTQMSKEERLERVNFCLQRVHLENINHKFPSEISGGMKKRVGIARAIALDIKYLFCDEPNSGLDPITSRVIDDLILEITEDFNMTTVINTHDMKTVFDIGDKIIFIYDGQKWWEGTKSEVRKSGVKELQEFLKASYIE
ncbi:MAG: ATP-binding cassette domain-containing protein [Flavobacteriales bacterium]|nr:ATP-binding cassette domain-containing protein [Flavobacteriales bacterium]